MPLHGLPNGREHGEQKLRGSHRIKIGLKAEIQKSNGSGSYFGPTTTNGMFIIRDTVASIGANKSKTSSFVIEWDMMKDLGFTRDNVEQALKEHRNAPPGLLPHLLDFVLLGNAEKDPATGLWKFPGMFDGEYSAFNVKGLNANGQVCRGQDKPNVIEDLEWGKAGITSMHGCMCRGNGVTAKRRSPDGSMRLVDCHPRGKLGIEAKDFCPFHKTGRCKAGADLVVMLIKPRTDPKEAPQPLSPHFQSRFLLETTSVDNYLDFENELVEAANALNGEITGLFGAIEFRLSAVIKPEDPLAPKGKNDYDGDGSGSGIAPKLSIRLNRWQIDDRARQLGVRAVFANPGRTVGQIGGPVATEIVDATFTPTPRAQQEPQQQRAQVQEAEKPAAAAEQTVQPPKPRHEDISEDILFRALTEYVGVQAGEHDISFEDAWQDVAWIYGKGGAITHARLEGTPPAFAPNVSDPVKRLRFLRTICDRLIALDEEGWVAVLEQVREPSLATAAGVTTPSSAEGPAATEPAGAQAAAGEKRAEDPQDDGFYATDPK